MPTVEELKERVATSTLLSPDALNAFEQSFAKRRPGFTSEEFARALASERKLTRYQVRALWQGQCRLVLGNYEILDKIGGGGMGYVYKARHRRMNRVVALKVFPRSLLEDQSAVRRFHREVEAAGHLVHPNVVTAYDADEAAGLHFLVMEYVPGSNLSALVKKRGPLPVQEAVECILQAARGLEYAHQRGIVHRDVKPGNLVCALDGTVKVLDLGLARWHTTSVRQVPDSATPRDLIVGTIDYMAPEQALNNRVADRRSDVYSLGCTLFYLLTGRTIYKGGTLVTRLVAHREEPLPALRDERPDAPSCLDAVFRRMVAKSPNNRYQSMREVITDLSSCRNGSVVHLNAMDATEIVGDSLNFDLPAGSPTQHATRTMQRPLTSESDTVDEEEDALTAEMHPKPAAKSKSSISRSTVRSGQHERS